MKKLIINVSRSANDFRRIISSRNILNSNHEISIWDVCGIFPDLHFEHYDVIAVRSLDINNIIEKEAIENYHQFVSKLSIEKVSKKRNIRSFTINGFPLFWVSNIGFKHYYYSWGESIFFLLNLIKRKRYLFDSFNEVFIILPSGLSHLEDSMNLNFARAGLPATVYSIKDHSRFTVLYLGKIILLSLINLLCAKFFSKSMLRRSEGDKLIIITNYPSTWDSIQKEDMVLKGLKPFLNNDSLITWVPFFSNIKDVRGWLRDGSATDYIDNLLSISGFLKVSFQAISLYSNIYFSKFTDKTIDKVCLKKEALKREMIISIAENFVFLLQANALVKWFSIGKDKKQVFYQDEIYKSGRLISYCCNQNITKVESYGYQHGIVTPYDLIYKISDLEMNKVDSDNDKLPLPAYFLVWGEYFKSVILRNNLMSPDRIMAVGNIKSFNKSKTKHNFLISKQKKTNLRILWCANMIEYSLKEYLIIKDVLLEEESYTLNIRLHPSYNITKELENNIIDKKILKNVVFTKNKDIVTDIRDNDVVVTNDVSSVFLDSILEHTPVIRIVSNLFVNDSLGVDKITNIIFDVESPHKFKVAIESIKNNLLMLPNDEVLKNQYNSDGDILFDILKKNCISC